MATSASQLEDPADVMKPSSRIPRGIEYSGTANIEVTTPIQLEIVSPPAQVFLEGQNKRLWGWWLGEVGAQTSGRVDPGSRIELWSPGKIIISDA